MSVPESERSDPVPGTSTGSSQQQQNTSEEASSLPPAFKLLKEVNTDVILLTKVSKSISQLLTIFKRVLTPGQHPGTLGIFENHNKEMGGIVDRVVARGVELVLVYQKGWTRELSHDRELNLELLKRVENELLQLNQANEKIAALVEELDVLKKSEEESKQSKKSLEMELEDLRKVNEGLVTANELLKKLSIVREQAEEMARQSKMIEDLKRENETIRKTLEEETARRIRAETELNDGPDFISLNHVKKTFPSSSTAAKSSQKDVGAARSSSGGGRGQTKLVEEDDEEAGSSGDESSVDRSSVVGGSSSKDDDYEGQEDSDDKNVTVKVTPSKSGKNGSTMPKSKGKQQKDHFSLATSRRLRSETAKMKQGPDEKKVRLSRTQGEVARRNEIQTTTDNDDSSGKNDAKNSKTKARRGGTGTFRKRRKTQKAKAVTRGKKRTRNESSSSDDNYSHDSEKPQETSDSSE